MNHAEAISRLKALRAEAATLPPSTSSAEFNSWKPRTRSALTRALGEKHHITHVEGIDWMPLEAMRFAMEIKFNEDWFKEAEKPVEVPKDATQEEIEAAVAADWKRRGLTD